MHEVKEISRKIVVIVFMNKKRKSNKVYILLNFMMIVSNKILIIEA